MRPSLFNVLLGLGLLLIAVAVVALLTFESFEVPEGQSVFTVAEGEWAWTTDEAPCEGELHRITFSEDRSLMYIAYTDSVGAESVSTYEVLDSTRSSIRGAIRGETRLTDDGVPVVWDLVLRSEDHFAWQRTDWEPLTYTADLIRCAP